MPQISQTIQALLSPQNAPMGHPRERVPPPAAAESPVPAPPSNVKRTRCRMSFRGAGTVSTGETARGFRRRGGTSLIPYNTHSLEVNRLICRGLSLYKSSYLVLQKTPLEVEPGPLCRAGTGWWVTAPVTAPIPWCRSLRTGRIPMGGSTIKVARREVGLPHSVKPPAPKLARDFVLSCFPTRTGQLLQFRADSGLW